MYRVLLVSGDQYFASLIQKQLQDDFSVETCGSGQWALELINEFSPDIMILDNVIADLDCISVLQAVKVSGKLIHVVVYSNLVNPYIDKQLERLGVELLVTKPCKIPVLGGHVRMIASMIENNSLTWNEEQVLDDLLLELGFYAGTAKFHQIREAILIRYRNSHQMMMKEIYVDVGRKCGGTNQSLEKAVRDAIKVARCKGNPQLWNLLFPNCVKDGRIYPRSEEFIDRIVMCLRQQTRIKPAYKELPAKII